MPEFTQKPTQGDIVFFNDTSAPDAQLQVGFFWGVPEERETTYAIYQFHSGKLILRTLTTESITIQSIFSCNNADLKDKACSQLSSWALRQPIHSPKREHAAEHLDEKLSKKEKEICAIYSAIKFAARSKLTPSRQQLDKPPQGFFSSGFFLLCYQVSMLTMHHCVNPPEPQDIWPTDKHGSTDVSKYEDNLRTYLRLIKFTHHTNPNEQLARTWWVDSQEPTKKCRELSLTLFKQYWKSTSTEAFMKLCQESELFNLSSSRATSPGTSP